MKLSRKIFLGILATALLLVSGLFLVFRSTGITNHQLVDTSVLRNGDLVFRRGRSAESLAVCLSDKTHRFSHVGVVAYEGSTPYIIHVVPGKPGYVLKETVAVFLDSEKASHYAIYRPAFSSSYLNHVATEALRFFREKRTFDNDYNLETDSTLYCTELVVKAFRNSGLGLKEIVPRNVDFVFGSYQVILPGAFITNSQFTCLLAE